MGADRDGAPTVGDGRSTSMSVLARDEELLVERNDIARLSLPAILFISCKIDKNNTTRGAGLGDENVSG